MGATSTDQQQRKAIGKTKVPVQFGEQVIVSLLYNHDANPVHHRPDHAIQWMLGLLAAQGVGGSEGGLERAGPEERTYALGTKLLERQDVVVMPGIVLAAICYEKFVPPSELTISLTTLFKYPLLVPTKGAVDVTVEAYELAPDADALPGCRKIQIEAFGPSVSGSQICLMKIDAVVYKAGTSAETIYERVVKPQFAELSQLAGKLPEMPALSHPSGISHEDRRRYCRIVEQNSATPQSQATEVWPITECAWQCKIPRVLTEVIDYMRHNPAYEKEVQAYHAGRTDQEERREAIRRYVAKEKKYNWITADQETARIDELSVLAQHLYARQHTVFDPRQFRENGAATQPGVQMHLDLQLAEMRLRRNIHRFYTAGRLKDTPVFMGEATVMSQPLVTRELANFLYEVNHSFSTLKLFEYKPRE